MDVVLIGKGGCMREIAWQMLELSDDYNIIGYTDNTPADDDIVVSGYKIKYLGDDSFFDNLSEITDVVVSVGEPLDRKRISEKLKKNTYIRFPNIYLGSAKRCADIEAGEGCVFCDGVKISTNVKLGNFVFCNIDSLICHDNKIGDYVTLAPRIQLAGNISIGECSYIGIGATAIQGISIGKNTVIGAGSTVIRNIPDDCTAVGVPTKIVKKQG